MTTEASTLLPSDPSLELLCHLLDYSLSHKTLVIELTKGDFVKGEKTYIHFAGVEFFCGPTVWKGAHFEVAAERECADLFESLGARKDQGTASMTRGYRLYKVRSTSGEVRILAAAMSTSRRFESRRS